MSTAKKPAKKPAKKDLPAPDTQGFRERLRLALTAKWSDYDQSLTPYSGEKPIASTTWGVYAFYDYDGEPIYVGQTKEKLATRIRRHLSNQRTDAVGMRVLDPFEILHLEMWPLIHLEGTAAGDPEATHLLNRLERTIYERSLAASEFGVILNEKIPPDVPILPEIDLPMHYRFQLVPDDVLAERRHPDNRIARRGETLGRLSNVIRERGEVSEGLRRVVVVQAARLAWLAAQRLAEVQAREMPLEFGEYVDLPSLVGGADDPDEVDPDAD